MVGIDRNPLLPSIYDFLAMGATVLVAGAVLATVVAVLLVRYLKRDRATSMVRPEEDETRTTQHRRGGTGSGPPRAR